MGPGEGLPWQLLFVPRTEPLNTPGSIGDAHLGEHLLTRESELLGASAEWKGLDLLCFRDSLRGALKRNPCSSLTFQGLPHAQGRAWPIGLVIEKYVCIKIL